MESLIAQNAKLLLKQQAKASKNELAINDIQVLETGVKQLKHQKKMLESEIEREEETYARVAQSKVERKLRLGVSEHLALKYKSTIEITNQKLDNRKAELNAKIAKLEEKKRAFNLEIEASIEKLEKDIELAESRAQGTLDYHNPLLDRCYEEIKPDVTLPPSHYKKKEQLNSVNRGIETATANLLRIKAAMFDAGPQEDPIDAQMKKAREKAFREAQYEEEVAKEKERERQQRDYTLRKLEQEREQQTRITKQKERESAGEIVQIPNSVLRIHVQCDDSDYDTDGELLSSTEKKKRKIQKKKDELEDIAWRKSKGLPQL